MVFFRLFKQRSTKAANTGKDKSPAPEQPVVKKEQAEPKPTAAPNAQQRKLPEMYQGRKWSMNDPIPYDSISAEDVSFQNVQHVMDSWQTVTMIENWQGIAGELLLRKYVRLCLFGCAGYLSISLLTISLSVSLFNAECSKLSPPFASSLATRRMPTGMTPRCIKTPSL